MEGVKTTDVSVTTAADGLKEGEALAMFSVYDNVDSDGDMVKAGEWDAFAEEFNASGRPMPVLFAHDHRNLDAYIGDAVELDPKAVDDNGRNGIAAKVRFDLEDNAGRKAHRLAKGNRITQWSYHYRAERVKAEDGDHYLLKGLRASEISLVLRGANDQTSTLQIKARGSAFADIEGMLNPETVQLIRDLDAEGRSDVAGLIRQHLAKRKGDDPGLVKGLELLEAELWIEQARLIA